MVRDVVAGRYELEELVGSGGMSSVYRAHDRVLERTVALKVLHRRLTDDDEYVDRFRREALMVAGLLHPNIVTVIDRGEDDGLPFIVFEYVGGRNLKQIVLDEGPLPVERALELAIQIARGLAFAHEHGYVHRDVKPQNVLLNGDGEAKVTDFGIARSLEVKHGVTQTGAVLGTSDYIAPEQAQGQHVDEHTDVYSLGVVLYELLTGELPFSGDNFVTVALQHINDLPPRVSELRPDVLPRLDAAVAKALAKRTEDRFATMADFGHELQSCLDETRLSEGASPTVVLAPPRIQRPRRVQTSRPRRHLPAAAMLITLGLAVAVAALTFALVREDGPGGAPPARGSGTSIALRAVAPYDPPPGDGVEGNSVLPLATDGNLATAWSTEYYANSHFGNLKSGVGIVLDAARTVTVHRLTVTTDTPGYTAKIKAGHSASGPFHDVSGVQTVTGRTTFDLSNASARYYLIWITDLGSSNHADVNDVTAS